MYFTLDYAEHATLDDGTRVSLRLLRATDREMVQRGFERLSAHSRYSRFLAPKSTLTESELRYLTEIDQESHVAIGAIRDADGEGLGLARFIRMSDDATRAEVAITVADEAQGKGLGRLLFVRLAAAAAERGIATLRLEVLGSNEQIKQLVRAVSPEHTSEIANGVASIELPVPAVSPTELPTETSIAMNPLYRAFRLAAEQALAWTAIARRFVSLK
ncbi:MAG TPA: GNAT family N-acetyltransferase [Kofleriaceae bacterium]|jgi:GNAT superfamily N-acetyltransferase